ncbi:MAG: DNA polymerase III subunit delta [Acidobacteriota bacterium]
MIPAAALRVLEKFPPKKPLLVLGENLHEAEAVLNEVRRRAADAGIESISTYHGDETGWGRLVDYVSTGDLFGDRLVIVREADRVREDRNGAQEALLSKPPAGTYLVFRASDLDKRKTSTAHFEKHCTKIRCDLPTPEQVPDWIRSYAHASGFSLSPTAAQMIATLSENEPLRIAMELDKMFLYLGDRRRIEDGDVNACFSINREEKPWAVADHLLQGDTEAALLSLKRLFDAGASTGSILWLLSGHLRKRYEIARLADRGASPAEITRRLESRPPVSFRDVDVSMRIGSRALGEALAEAVRTEALVKSAGLSDRLLLDAMIHRISRILGHPGRRPVAR